VEQPHGNCSALEDRAAISCVTPNSGLIAYFQEDSAFASLWADGEVLSLQDAITLALR
jgi:hypothetical protein